MTNAFRERVVFVLLVDFCQRCLSYDRISCCRLDLDKFSFDASVDYEVLLTICPSLLTAQNLVTFVKGVRCLLL